MYNQIQELYIIFFPSASSPKIKIAFISHSSSSGNSSGWIICQATFLVRASTERKLWSIAVLVLIKPHMGGYELLFPNLSPPTAAVTHRSHKMLSLLDIHKIDIHCFLFPLSDSPKCFSLGLAAGKILRAYVNFQLLLSQPT